MKRENIQRANDIDMELWAMEEAISFFDKNGILSGFRVALIHEYLVEGVKIPATMNDYFLELIKNRIDELKKEIETL